MKQFVHLHLHTEYSLVDSIVRVPELMDSVSTQGMASVALTDVNNLFALVKFYRAAVQHGVKPIIGLEARVSGLSPEEPDSRIVFLCRNEEGYKTLTKLVTQAYLENQDADGPVLQRNWLAGAGEGLIVLSGAKDGDVGKAILSGYESQANACVEFWRSHFPDRYYIELQRTGREEEEQYIFGALDLAAKFSLPVVASNDVRFLHRHDYEAHEARVCIQTGCVLNDSRRPHLYSEQQYLRSCEEMAELFSDIPEAITNSVEIAKRCNVTLTFGDSVLPRFPIPGSLTPQEYMLAEAEGGLAHRLEKKGMQGSSSSAQEYLERLHSELKVINTMGYAGYFLIVADFIKWAKENAIPVGPGRGSGAGSLVSYALGITDIDPLEYDLLFERFLNPERISMPDFDIDFCMANRDRVIEYVAQRYGQTRVSQIITYGSMAARAVVRDVGRVLGFPYGFVDRIAKLIPFEVGMTLSKALQREPALQEQYEDEEDVRMVVDMAKSLEGLVRNAGKHAGGVVIAPAELTEFTPLYCEEGGANVVTQLDKDDVETIGLVKFDFLGLRTLTIIDNTVRMANQKLERQGQSPISIDTIPLDDKATYASLRRQQTTAVFQLESSGIKDIIKRLKPDNFNDIVALVALYRPGPLQSGMVDDFIQRKHGARVNYFHPDLEPVLRQTYGVILYQEQVMQIAQILAGYTLGRADILRRAMGKKKPEEMAQQREIFVSGAVERGVREKKAQHIFDLMEKFAGYGFNKSHSVAYALLAYQTIWLKTHFPAEFMSSVMSSDIDNTDKVVNLIDECRRLGLGVLPPDISSSHYDFTVPDDKNILYGLGAIKGVGRGAVQQIVEIRNRSGEYKSLDEFCMHLDSQKVNRRCMEALIRAGAMDCFGHTRASLFEHLDTALRQADQRQRDSIAGQNDMFSQIEKSPKVDTVQGIAEWDDETKLSGERQTLGLYLTGHPIEHYQEELKNITNHTVGHLLNNGGHNVKQTRRAREGTGKEVLVAGLLDQIRLRNSAKGRIAFLTLDDNTGRMDVAVFANDYARFNHLLVKDAILIIKGSLGWDEFAEQVRVRADEIWSFDEYLKHYGGLLSIRVKTSGTSCSWVQQLQQQLLPFKDGNCSIRIEYEGSSAAAQLEFPEDWNISLDQKLLQELREISEVSGTNVVYRKPASNA
ncbi:MAG: DNA polymerase III subunit alpha [Gammaproteobacteria bacterium]|nr:DNA polymerase III subunit alpha [Gammaproteobacteria bacterium]